MKPAPLILFLPLLALAACKPPPTDEADARGTLVIPQKGPSEPIDSPDSENAIWVSSATPGRIIYGNPGEAPMMALACIGDGSDSLIHITRITRADEGAQAFIALIGNSHVARFEIDATEARSGFVWEGTIAPDDPRLEVLTGRRSVTATVPGGGMITLNGSTLPGRIIDSCRVRFDPSIADDMPEIEAASEQPDP